MYAQRESEELPYLITSFYCLMYYYSFVSVKWEYQESLDNYKRSICISFSACLGNGVPIVLFIDRPPLSWPSLITHCLLRIEKRTKHSLLVQSTWNLKLFFVIFEQRICLISGSPELILWTSITWHY